ncbi:MAG: IS66 family insertion sequence element accessory protein TnpA [Paludibacteraceae bacterium]
MELRLKQWIPIFEEQAKSGLNKQEWCRQNDVKRTAFFKWQRELQKYLLDKNKDKPSNALAVHTAPDFVELAPASTPAKSGLNNCCVRSGDITPASSISIKCGEFSIDLNDNVNELLLSKVLKVMANVY